MQDAEKQTEKMDQSEPFTPEQGQEQTAAGNGQATGDAAQDQQQQLAAAQAKIAEMQDAFLRARAEAENIRRRAQEDVSKAHKFAIEAFAELLVPVRDSLEMALTVETPSVASLKEGVEMTLKQLATAFDKNKLTEVSPQPGDKLDPTRHQAISMVPAEQDANTIVTVLQKGYMISDRLLRPALVTVSQGK